MKATLQAEAERFRSLYPNSSARFAEIIGKRVSHVAGPVHKLHMDERRIPINDRIVLFVSDGDGISDEELQRFADRVAARLVDGARQGGAECEASGPGLDSGAFAAPSVPRQRKEESTRVASKTRPA